MYNDCLFCNCLSGHIENAKKILPNISLSNLITDQTSHFYLTYELFPINEDPYFLIIPKDHYTSFGSMEADIDMEMDSMVRNAVSLYRKFNYIIFEHGEQENGRKAQSVYHAHTHLILSNRSYIEQMKEELNKLEIPYDLVDFPTYSTHSLLTQRVKRKSYLLFRENNRGLIVVEDKSYPVFSQFFRILMNKIDNQRPFVNWKEYKEDDISVIKNRLSSIMTSRQVEVATGVLTVDNEGKILLLKSKKEFESWVVPGGHIEYHESIEDCAKRELLEETGLAIKDVSYLQTQESLTKRFDVDKKITSNRHFIFLNCVAKTKLTSPKVVVEGDKLDYIWIHPHEALRILKINEATQRLIRKYIETLL